MIHPSCSGTFLSIQQKFRIFHMPSRIVHSGCKHSTQLKPLCIWLLYLLSGYRRATLETIIMSNGKGHFGPVGPVERDHLQRWSQIFRLNRTEMVRSIQFWAEWKAPMVFCSAKSLPQRSLICIVSGRSCCTLICIPASLLLYSSASLLLA